MVGSIDSLDFFIESSFTENDAVPLHCWQNISLSDIWISSHLLPNRNKTCNTEGAQGLYHTLEKKDYSKYIGSFSVYLDSDIKSGQEEIFLSESDEDIFGSDSVSFEKIEKLSKDVINNTTDVVLPFTNSCYSNNNETDLYCSKNLTISDNVNETCEYNTQKSAKKHSEGNLETDKKGIDEENCVLGHNITKNITLTHSNLAFVGEFHDRETKGFKGMHMLERENKDSDSHISLKEIVNVSPEINLKDFSFALKKNDSSDILSIGNEQKINKSKDKKGKKKHQKSIPLGMLFEDRDTTQDFYCDKYFLKLLQETDRNDRISKNPVRCNEEFPDLVSKSNEATFIHSEKTIKEKNVEFNTKSPFVHSEEVIREENVESSANLNLNKCEVAKIENVQEMQTLKIGKIVIENIPHDVCKDDILLILCGYGDIKNFSMISSGKSFKVFVEIELCCDIDWVIECLHGSEPFGASSGVLKCYEQL